MGHDFSLSIFTIEINGTPTIALQAKRRHEAEQFCEQDRLRADLSTFTSHGLPLCDAKADMRVRLATLTEADLFRKATKSNPASDKPSVVYLVHLDR